MKRVLFLSMLIAACMSMSAQITSSQTDLTRRTVVVDRYQGWNSVYVEYLPSKLSSGAFNGAALNYAHAFSVTQKMPLFVEVGLGGQYSFQDENGAKMQFASVKVPLNVIYEFSIPGTSISLDPFAGIKTRVNVWGEITSNEYDIEYDLFDENEGRCKRVQVGWNAGLKLRVNNAFFVGGAYGTDFMKFSPNHGIKEFAVSLGLTF